MPLKSFGYSLNITMVWKLLLVLTVIGSGLCYIDGDEMRNPIEEEIVPKQCSEPLVTSKIVQSYFLKTCYSRIKTTTRRFLFIKKTRYYIQSYKCQGSQYKREFEIYHRPVCCHGYTERGEECVKEVTTSPNATCTCFHNESLVVNITTNKCHCEETKNESCSEIDIEKLTESTASCPDGCVFQRLSDNCSAICSCSDDVDEENNSNFTEVRSQISMGVSDSYSSGLVAGMLILVVIVVVAIIALLVVIKKKISRKTKKRAVMNLSYSFIEPNGDNIIRNTTTTASPNYDLAYSGVNLPRSCAAEATNSKSLAVDKIAKENTYVTYNMGKGLGQASDDNEPFLYDFPSSDNIKNIKTEKDMETPYDLPKEFNQREADNTLLYDFPTTQNQKGYIQQQGEGETAYDFPKSSGKQYKVLKNNHEDIKFQTEPQKYSTYDTPKSLTPQKSNNVYSVVVKSNGHRPVAGEISDRDYVAMSVSSKGGMEMEQDNDMYVLPSDIQGANGALDSDVTDRGTNKVTHTYSNVSFGPYENVI